MGFKDKAKEKRILGEDSNKPKKEKWAGASSIAAERSNRYVPDWEDIAEPPTRLVMSSEALQKRGKSRFAFTMPAPLAYLQLDANFEHILKWARSQKKFAKKDSLRHLRYFADPRADIKSANRAVFDRLIKDFDYCCDEFAGGSVVIDTASELLDVRKLAEFGRNTSIVQIYYGGFYADLRWMVKRALDSNCNVNFIHRRKKEYRGDAWTGDYTTEGWAGIVYETQVHVVHDRVTEKGETTFSTTIQDCAQDARLMGIELTDDDNNFDALAKRVLR